MKKLEPSIRRVPRIGVTLGIVLMLSMVGCGGGATKGSASGSPTGAQAASPASTVPSGWTLHSDQADGFSIATPAGWVEKSSSNQLVKILLSDPVTNASVNVVVATVPTSVSLDDFEKANVRDAESNPGIQIHPPINQQRVTLPAGEAGEVSYRATVSGIQASFRQYLMVKSGAGYVVTFTSPLESAATLGSTFDQIIDTFRIT
jgi:hypothetical protein